VREWVGGMRIEIRRWNVGSNTVEARAWSLRQGGDHRLYPRPVMSILEYKDVEN